MASNIDRYRTDLEALIKRGDDLDLALKAQTLADETEAALTKQSGKSAKVVKEFLSKLPTFSVAYQAWYSEAKVLVKQLLPDRLGDFVRHYEKPKPRKDITYESYRIEDCLQGLTVTRGWEKEKVVGRDAAIPHFEQQLAILRSASARFESSLFDIRQLVTADLFDSELDTASELVRNKFVRAAGAVAGVVLEKHLAQVCEAHGLKVTKKAPSIGDLNAILKEANVVDIPTWRFIQHLADIRNLCDHDKKAEPTEAQVNDLVTGVSKIVKTLF
jgi:hypothetical protein